MNNEPNFIIRINNTSYDIRYPLPYEARLEIISHKLIDCYEKNSELFHNIIDIQFLTHFKTYNPQGYEQDKHYITLLIFNISLLQYVLDNDEHRRYRRPYIIRSYNVENMLFYFEQNNIMEIMDSIEIYFNNDAILLKIYKKLHFNFDFKIIPHLLPNFFNANSSKYLIKTLLKGQTQALINFHFTHSRREIHNRMDVVEVFLEHGISLQQPDLSRPLTCNILNRGYPIITQFTEQANADRIRKQLTLCNVINNLKIESYDLNISNIIKEYVSYE